jgi:hypothetical protein
VLALRKLPDGRDDLFEETVFIKTRYAIALPIGVHQMRDFSLIGAWDELLKNIFKRRPNAPREALELGDVVAVHAECVLNRREDTDFRISESTVEVPE